MSNQISYDSVFHMQTRINKEKIQWGIKIITGNISVMSSPPGFNKSRILCAQANLMSGSMAQKNL